MLLRRRDERDLPHRSRRATRCSAQCCPTRRCIICCSTNWAFRSSRPAATCRDEPIVTDEHEALDRLAGIADLFLVHDRPIVRPVDDSVAQVVAGRPQILRRARGYAPRPCREADVPPGILAVGGHLKTHGRADDRSRRRARASISATSTRRRRATRIARRRRHRPALRHARPAHRVRDLHPDYASTPRGGGERPAGRRGPASSRPCRRLHGRARPRAARCSASPGTAPATAATARSGAASSCWSTDDGWRRVAHLRPFRLPGGEAAVREPRRAAFGLLHEAFGADALAMTRSGADRRLRRRPTRDALPR